MREVDLEQDLRDWGVPMIAFVLVQADPEAIEGAVMTWRALRKAVPSARLVLVENRFDRGAPAALRDAAAAPDRGGTSPRHAGDADRLLAARRRGGHALHQGHGARRSRRGGPLQHAGRRLQARARPHHPLLPSHVGRARQGRHPAEGRPLMSSPEVPEPGRIHPVIDFARNRAEELAELQTRTRELVAACLSRGSARPRSRHARLPR